MNQNHLCCQLHQSTKLADPAGIEPTFSGPKPDVIAIILRVHKNGASGGI